MQIIKRVLLFLLFLMIIGVFGFLWITKFSPKARKAKINVENSYKLKIGMNTNEIIRIMGDPENIIFHEEGISDDSV